MEPQLRMQGHRAFGPLGSRRWAMAMHTQRSRAGNAALQQNPGAVGASYSCAYACACACMFFAFKSHAAQSSQYPVRFSLLLINQTAQKPRSGTAWQYAFAEKPSLNNSHN